MNATRRQVQRHAYAAAAFASALVAMVSGCKVARCTAAEGESPPARAGVYAKWHNGPSRDAAYFPIAVWLQDPKNARKYQALGVNLFVGLWKGPTDAQIAELKRDGMPVICDQNEYALKHLDEETIVGWMHGDEPDNAQSLGSGKGYGPPIPPEKIIAAYRKIKKKDPTRPVMLNLGQDMARLLGSQGIAIAVKKHQGATYLFAVRMEGSPAQGTFQMAGMTGEATIRVIGEDRTIRARDGRFADDFAPHAVHLYQIDSTGKWKAQIPEIKGQLTPERVRSLSRWAKTQMEGYKSVPSFVGTSHPASASNLS